MKNIITLLIITLTTFNVMAQQANPNVVFSVRFQDKQVYYPNSPIVLRASIKNFGVDDYVFELADDPFFNIDIAVRTLTNIPLPVAETYIRRTQSNETRPVLYRHISLKSGEEHSFEMVLNDFVAISTPGTFIVQANFRTQAKLAPLQELVVLDNNNRLVANTLSLTVRPSVANRTFQDKIDADTGEILQQENLSPDQIIQFLLTARQQEQWNKFFLYINLEQLFLNNVERSRRYNYADVQQREQMIINFKEQLMDSEVESELSTIPQLFTVLKTSYTADAAEVITRQVYRQRQFDEVKEFRWFLRRDTETGIWLVYDYFVTNLGNERPQLLF